MPATRKSVRTHGNGAGTRRLVHGVMRVVALAATGLMLLGNAAEAADIRLLSAAAMQSVFKEVVAGFEGTSGHHLIITYDTIGGVERRMREGAAADFVIGSSLIMPALATDGKIAADSLVTVCRTGIGMVTPAGASKPEIVTVADFKHALLAAHTLVYADPARGGAAGVHVARVIERLGLTEVLKPKTRLAAGGDITEVTLALGEGTLGMTQISEIVEKHGADYLGPFPDELQNYTLFVGGVPPGARSSEAVTAFVAFLKSPTVVAVIRRKGMRAE